MHGPACVKLWWRLHSDQATECKCAWRAAIVPQPTYIYHITSIDNLASIIKDGGLHAYGTLGMRETKYTNIAHATIQERRARCYVECGSGGTLHDYVPFYFAPRSPMLYTISRGNVGGYSQGQESIVHLIATVQDVRAAGHTCVFTNGHAAMEITEFYDELNRLDQIDWAVMSSKYWSATLDDPDRARRRQAEFLVHQFFPWEMIRGIGVMSRRINDQAGELLQICHHKPRVVIRRLWYY